MIHSVLPLFLVIGLGSSASIVGLIDGVAESVASLFKLLFGALSDYLGKRKSLLVFGYGLSTLVKVFFAIATSPLMVLLARCLDRLGKGIRSAPRDALVADVTEPSMRGAAYGLRQSLDSVGAFIGPLIAVAVLSMTNNDYRQVFWIALLPGLITVSLLIFGIREPEHIAKSSARTPVSFSALKSFEPSFWLIFAVALLFTLGNSSDSFILLKTKLVGISTNLIPLIFVVINVCYSITAYPAGKLSDRIGKKKVLLTSFALYALVYAGFAMAENGWQMWLLVVAYGVQLGFSQGTLLAIVSDRVVAESRGTAFGLVNLAIGVGMLPASLLAGWLWDSVSPQSAFLAGSGFALLAFLVLCLDRPPASYAVSTQEDSFVP
jgi:MFS family permease